MKNERYLSEDCYFLDRELAYETACKRNIICVENQNVVQICYHDGEPYESPPDNLIAVSVKHFTEFFAKNSLRIPTYFYNGQSEINTQQENDLQLSFLDIISEVLKLRSTYSKQFKPRVDSNKDTYFFDRTLAYKTAMEKNRVLTPHPDIDGLQVCYYDGEEFSDPPSNLIAARFDSLSEVFSNTTHRLPNYITYPSSLTAEQQHVITDYIQNAVVEAEKVRSEKAKYYRHHIKLLRPEIDNNTKFRILLPSSRYTTVMQYVSQNLAKSLNKLGHTTRLVMENSETELYDEMLYMKALYEFNPHVIIHINHLHNDFLNPEVFNVIWWQDPVEEIRNGKILDWRERDIVLSAYPQFDRYLKKAGASEIERQGFCIDPDVFNSKYGIERQEKIVFIGSSYSDYYLQYQKYINVIEDEIMDDLINGRKHSIEDLQSFAIRCDLQFELFSNYLYNFLVRVLCVHWICEQTALEVDVYGNGWENDSVVSHFHRGTLPHGEEVAKVYNQAKYALVAMPSELNSQRLAEIAACGGIPIVWDCRFRAEKPHWDEQCLFFSTQNELETCLGNIPPGDPNEIALHNTYDAAASKILDLIERKLRQAAA